MPEGGFWFTVACARAVEWVWGKIRGFGRWSRDVVGLVTKMRVLWAEHEKKPALTAPRAWVESGGICWSKHETGEGVRPYCNVCRLKEGEFYALTQMTLATYGSIRLECLACKSWLKMGANVLDAHCDFAKKHLPE